VEGEVRLDRRDARVVDDEAADERERVLAIAALAVDELA
jgi:hypothetical protein